MRVIRRQGAGRDGPGRAWRAVSIGLAATLVVSACGGDQDPDPASGDQGDGPGTAAAVFEEFNAMTGQARHDALVAAAEAEGSLVFYTASAGMDPVVAAFEDTYDISVDLFSGGSDTVLQRIMQENEVGLYSVDVFDDSEAFTIAQAGLTHEYVNDEVTSQLPGYDASTHVAPTRLSVYTAGWNTDLISEDELPDTLDGFTDPRFEGRLSLDPTNWIWYTGVLDYYVEEMGWTEEQVDEMMRTLASYSTYHQRAVVQAEFLVAGDFPVSLSLYPQIVERITTADADAPIAWRKSDGGYIKPLIVEPQGIALLKNAPHPAAALLFVDFILTEGQVILSEEDRTPTAVTQPGGPLEGVAPEDLIPVDFQKFLDERDEWATRFDELLP